MDEFRQMRQELDLPGIGQIAFVEDDLCSAARAHGKAFGIEKWYRPQIFKQQIVYKGNPVEEEIRIAVGYSGKTQVELVERNLKRDSLFEDPPAKHADGPHHIGFFVPDAETCQMRLEKQGLQPVQHGSLWFARRHRTRFCYFDLRTLYGCVIELIEHRVHGRLIGLPKWYVMAGAWTGHVSRL